MNPLLVESIRDLAASGWAAAGDGLLRGSIVLLALVVVWWPLRQRLSATLSSIVFALPLLQLAAPLHVSVPDWLAPLSWPHWLPSPAPSDSGGLIAILVDEGDHTAAAPAPVALGWRELLFLGWVLGAFLLLVRLGLGQWRTWRLVHRAVPVAAAAFPLDLDALRRRAGVRRRVDWRVSAQVPAPAVAGWLRPCVLVPVDFADSLPPRQLAFVLLHELAHVRRHDVAVTLLQRLVQALWFFHPAVWLANWSIDQHRELACDQDALARSGASRRECGEAFLSVAAWVGGATTRSPAPVNFDATRALQRRLMQILKPTSSRSSRLWTAAFLGFAAAVALPSTRAAAPVESDLLTLLQQEEGSSRQEIEQLRRALAELKQQHAELRKQLQRLKQAAADDDDAAPREGTPKKAAKVRARVPESVAGERVHIVEVAPTPGAKTKKPKAGHLREIEPGVYALDVQGGVVVGPGGKGLQALELGRDGHRLHLVEKDGSLQGVWRARADDGEDDDEDDDDGEAEAKTEIKTHVWSTEGKEGKKIYTVVGPEGLQHLPVEARRALKGMVDGKGKAFQVKDGKWVQFGDGDAKVFQFGGDDGKPGKAFTFKVDVDGTKGVWTTVPQFKVWRDDGDDDREDGDEAAEDAGAERGKSEKVHRLELPKELVLRSKKKGINV